MIVLLSVKLLERRNLAKHYTIQLYYILPTRRNLEAEAQMDSSYSLATESHTGAGREA